MLNGQALTFCPKLCTSRTGQCGYNCGTLVSCKGTLQSVADVHSWVSLTVAPLPNASFI